MAYDNELFITLIFSVKNYEYYFKSGKKSKKQAETAFQMEILSGGFYTERCESYDIANISK